MILDIFSKEPILFIGCHPDDIELGCGGLIHKLKQKNKLYAVTLSKNQKNPNNKNLVKENINSLTSLGIKKNKILFGDFLTREFSYSRQKICDFLLDMKKTIKPSCIFTTPYDLHQDHQICNAETKRIFRDSSIIEYELARSTVFPKPSIFVSLSKDNINAKYKALQCYRTYKNKNYFDKQKIYSLAETTGIRSELDYCESFVPINLIFD